MVETTESRRRSRTTLIAVTAGVVVAAALLGYGFSRSDDDRVPSTDTSPIVGVIQAPANVATTQGPVLPPGTPPATADVPTVPTGTADVAFPPVSVGTPSP